MLHGAELAKAVPGCAAHVGARGNCAPEVQIHHGEGGLKGAGVAHESERGEFPVNVP